MPYGRLGFLLSDRRHPIPETLLGLHIMLGLVLVMFAPGSLDSACEMKVTCSRLSKDESKKNRPHISYHGTLGVWLDPDLGEPARSKVVLGFIRKELSY